MHLRWNEFLSARPREAWGILTDFRILAQCFPGCDSLTPVGTNRHWAVVTVPMAGFTIPFEGSIHFDLRRDLHEYVLSLDLSGSSGSVRATGHFLFSSEGTGTRLLMTWNVTFTGKIASMGEPVLKGIAQIVIESFFRNVAERFGTQAQSYLVGDATFIY